MQVIDLDLVEEISARVKKESSVSFDVIKAGLESIRDSKTEDLLASDITGKHHIGLVGVSTPNHTSYDISQIDKDFAKILSKSCTQNMSLIGE